MGTHSFRSSVLRWLLVFLAGSSFSFMSPYGTSGQSVGNTIGGHIYGIDRRPVYDANIELLDEYSRLISRARSDSSGRYTFSSLGPGRFTVRVRAFESDYEEAEGSVEIVNFIRENQQSGERRLSGFSNEQLDFYLRVRKGAESVTGVLFVQDVPPGVKKIYEKAVTDLNEKREIEGIKGLKSAIETFPKYYIALTRLADEYIRLKHFEAAQILYSAAAEVNPRSYRSWYGIAYSLNALGKSAGGLDAVRKAVEVNPNSAEAVLLLGVLLRANAMFAEAETQFLKAKGMFKTPTPMVHWYLALVYGNDLKRYDDAARELKAFLKLQPDAKDAANIRQLIVTYEEKAKTKS